MRDERQPLTFGSLFAGIGGFDLGLERAGMRCLWQVEVKEWRRERLARHWPMVPKRGDIRLARGADLWPVDLICGGFPCQDISAAGKGAGITGRRSGLWTEMLRLVCELRPPWVLAENVPALRTRGADRVLADLEAAGYTCEPLVVGAWAVGAPHRRDRVWIVGHAPFRGREGSNVREGWAESRWDEKADAGGASGMVNPTSKRREGEQLHGERRQPLDDTHGGGLRAERWPARPGEPQHEWEAPRTLEPRMGRPAHGVPRRLALAALGDAVVPQVVEMIGRAIVARCIG